MSNGTSINEDLGGTLLKFYLLRDRNEFSLRFTSNVGSSVDVKLDCSAIENGFCSLEYGDD